MPVSGFADAPLTKGMMILSCLLPLFANLLLLKPYAHLQLQPHILQQGQFWRIATFQLCLMNSSEVLLSTLLLYRSGRTVERIFGTPKYAAFVLYSYMLSALLATALMLASTRVSGDSWLALIVPSAWREQGRLPGGTFALVAALCHQHAQLVPDTWLVHFGPWLLGDRALDWVVLALLALSQVESSAVLVAIGLFTSALYASKLPILGRLRQFRIPSLLFRILAMLGEPWIGSTRLPQRSSRAEPRRRRTRAQRNAERLARDGPPRGPQASTAAGAGLATGAEGDNAGATNNRTAVRYFAGLVRRWSRRDPPAAADGTAAPPAAPT